MSLTPSEALEALSARTAALETHPRVLLLSALDGSFPDDPELLTLAGGTPTALSDGPEVLILALPETSLDDAEELAIALSESDAWWELPCVTEHDCYLVAGKFLGEGADRAEAARILATILHPSEFTEMLPPYSVRMFPEECYTKPDPADDAS